MIVGIIVVLVLLGGGFVIWKRRAPKSASITEQDVANVNERGVWHPDWLRAHAEAMRTASDVLTHHYTVVERDSPFSLKYGKTYDYTGVKLSDLVQRIELVDRFGDSGARGNIHRENGVTTMGLVRAQLRDLGHFKHELGHALSWDRPEIMAQCQKYSDHHWPPLLVDGLGD